eukprot:Nitzschia sp. Nitz4//scaffold239_size30010//1167//2957//NITZ4_008009-RA/size30010-processed-gene-0.9-mRNA-1//-1//CDS//3329543559//7736//frame0
MASNDDSKPGSSGEAASAPTGIAASSVWRNPSAANQAKYHLKPLPEDFAPTPQESALIRMYDTIKNFTREAARWKEQKAREKLQAREDEFKKTLAKKRKNRRVRNPNSGAASGDDDEDDGDNVSEDEEAEAGSDMEEEQARQLEERRAAKLERLREEVESKQQKMQEQETKQESMRDHHLTTNEDVDLGPTLKRRKFTDKPDDASALLTSMMTANTPPHDFSKNSGISVVKGKYIYQSTATDGNHWAPPETPMNPNDGAFLVELENFDVREASNGKGNNTLAIKFFAPTDSKRFSLNIAGPDHNDFDSILLHFNPRQFERGGQLVINDKQTGVWGKALNLPLSQVPLIFGQTAITLQIQINSEGFDVFIEDKHCARLEHRKELPSKSCSLYLQFPSCDDYGSPENWMVYKAWWGNKPIMAKEDVASVPGVNSYNAMHPRKLFISALPRITSEAEVDIRRAELERAFRRFGGARGVSCIIPTNATFAFVEFEDDAMTDAAFTAMSSKYKINRARWTRHEALQDKRLKEEAARQGNTDASSAW